MSEHVEEKKNVLNGGRICNFLTSNVNLGFIF